MSSRSQPPTPRSQPSTPRSPSQPSDRRRNNEVQRRDDRHEVDRDRNGDRDRDRDDRSREENERDREQERQDEVDNLIFTMNDVANDGQDLAMQLRELIADQPAISSLVQDLASSLSLFGRTLRELALYLGTPASPFAMTTLEVVEVTLDHSEELFDAVDDMMYKFEKDPDRDFVYCFKDTKVLRLSAKLESSRLTLAVILQVLQLRALMNLQEMEDSDERSLRHRIKDLRLEAQSLVLDESWARRKEKLIEENNLADLTKDDTPIMPRHTMTEAAAAVTLLLDNLTEPWRSQDGKGRDRSDSKAGQKNADGERPKGLPENCPPDGSKEKRKQMMETMAKAAIAAGVLGIWRNRSKVPLPKTVKQKKDMLAQKAKPKHGKSILNGISGQVEAIAPVALAAGVFELYRSRKEKECVKDKGMRFLNATKGAAFSSV